MSKCEICNAEKSDSKYHKCHQIDLFKRIKELEAWKTSVPVDALEGMCAVYIDRYPKSKYGPPVREWLTAGEVLDNEAD